VSPLLKPRHASYHDRELASSGVPAHSSHNPDTLSLLPSLALQHFSLSTFNMKLSLSTISIHADIQELAECIERCNGLLILKDLPTAPFESVLDLLQHASWFKERLNEAYPKNLVYKDSYAAGNGGPTVDRKRVLDLSPERLAEIAKSEPALVDAPLLQQPLKFFQTFQDLVAEKVLPALAKAIGSDDVLDDVAYNYRMVDYYPSVNECEMTAPRCGEHRDFGSLTVIQATHPGLQVFLDNEWQELPPVPQGSTLLLFGWCTQIRSNGRIPAVLHRVDRHFDATSRVSAVLFCAPKHEGTILEPAVRLGEVRKYIGGVKVGQLRGSMARKWRHREGTLSNEAKILEEEEILATNMKTQDDVVDRIVKVSA
jgi:hypothetical protein